MVAKQWLGRWYWLRAFLVTASGALFFSPTQVQGFHTIMTVPVIYQLCLSEAVGVAEWASLSLGAGILSALSIRYWFRERAHVQVASRLERVWRGA